MNAIRLFEFFSGIGSQYKALKNIAKNSELEIISSGCCEWYIDAIVSYLTIHYGELKPETKLTREQMSKILNNYTFSADSKTPVSNNFFIKSKNLSKIFPYLYAFVNNDYFNKVYKTNKKLENYTDITKVDNIQSNIDIMTYSFPCQDLSQQGKQKGLEKGTRSGLLYEIERILLNSKHKPKVLILENVKALTTKKFINNFLDWVKTLENLGYSTSFQTLNSSDFGSSQNRERVFAVSILNNQISEKFDFNNLQRKKPKKVSSIVKESNVGIDCSNLIDKYKLTPFNTSINGINKARLINYSNFNSETYVYLTNDKGPTLTASGANSRLKFYFPEKNKLRYINACEAIQYMGFDKKDYLQIKKSELVTENKIIFLSGNSISVEVLEAIFNEVVKWF
ncbi:DNA (cytosine-5-)-methyltransferase [Mycoplasma anatis]|uniref:DNA (cytosine-5-)-methyltransferase N-terminal subunit n=1 Tax=Mycoplasmopsis anatis TaxID=171279 RepID=UPI001C4DDC46|nr:DNA (cytosine-5-)-methyltransferase [Mycoplasmopsis anatis]MBW0594955.1 DNA (cytosine-5-)-methyltransferase [Mycoplasmopsis anatis]MBW0598550.1 DNA (cytosine-5-)-methyltransferase [Mycoplasmopsis anatis]MBW0599324.1 DNA (cytosine-5-)-methyltransferase [Mycoplasmopsis anatis]MBW0601520.1 DNA (cytosine-5-)-methyltransferase [Mycoplasmopsis anatis]